MSLPRQILPDTIYLLTRRCLRRRFLLRPSPDLDRIFLYCLAIAAKKFEMEIHAFCVLSNHYHIVATDRHGRLPEFMHWLNEYLAKCINTLYGRTESFWAPGSYNAVRLAGATEVLEKIVYVLCNPVSAGLVSHGDRWPGLRSRPSDVGKTMFSANRPNIFFRSGGPLSERASLKLVVPDLFLDKTEEFIEDLQILVNEREQAVREKLIQEGRVFFGERRVLRQSPEALPSSNESAVGFKPRVACRDKRQRLKLLEQYHEFLNSYRDAWRRYRSGDLTAVFPLGTYWMKIHLGVMCASGP